MIILGSKNFFQARKPKKTHTQTDNSINIASIFQAYCSLSLSLLFFHSLFHCCLLFHNSSCLSALIPQSISRAICRLKDVISIDLIFLTVMIFLLYFFGFYLCVFVFFKKKKKKNTSSKIINKG